MPFVRMLALALVFLILAVLPAPAQSRPGEMRGVWMGSGYGRDWPTIMRTLRENGFNAIFPNMYKGGAAFYPSKVLPAAAGATPGRDELAEALKAAKQYGIEVHVWRINWMLEDTPPEVLKQYEAEGRLMRNPQGKLVRDDPDDWLKQDWLCPSNPKNRKQEKDAMLEVVRKYDVAGIQFDYMRFPSADYCFCDHCKAQFQKDTGTVVEHWPAEVVKGGKYGDRYERWRQGLQTSLVEEISDAAHEIKPNLRVSLAAWPDVDVARHQVLQDWPTWVDHGALDFICYMTYTLNATHLKNWLAPEVSYVNGRIPVYAGLGSFLMKDPAPLIEQIQAAREAGTDGFLAFAYYSGDVDKWLPRLHETVTASDPFPMPHETPAARLALSGPAVLSPASARQAKTGEKLTVEYALGAGPDADAIADEGAMSAASILRQSSQARKPVESYESEGAASGVMSGYQLSGRAVVETPGGDARLMLGAFSGDSTCRGKFTFTVPEGPFRVAIYGTEQSPEGKSRDFVVRSVLLTGVAAPSTTPAADATHQKLTGLVSEFLRQVKPEDVAGLNAAIAVSITGEGGGDWWFKIKDGKMDSGEGAREKADATLTCSADDALALARREVDPTTLLGTGRLMVTGDLLLVRRLLPLLNRTESGG